MSVTLMVVTREYTYPQAHQVVYIKYVQIFIQVSYTSIKWFKKIISYVNYMLCLKNIKYFTWIYFGYKFKL